MPRPRGKHSNVTNFRAGTRSALLYWFPPAEHSSNLTRKGTNRTDHDSRYHQNRTGNGPALSDWQSEAREP
eukprot:671649-Rhodomonas_salina.2